MNQPPSALRSALALAGFILVTFCAPLAGMFSLPGAWYAARWVVLLLSLVAGSTLLVLLSYVQLWLPI